MSNLLTIDLGNTNPRYALFSDDELTEVAPLSQLEKKSDLHGLPCMMSVVGKIPGFLSQLKKCQRINDIRNGERFLDMTVQYGEGLGEDRLALAYAAYTERKGDEKIMVIDAGTFLTVDLITDYGMEGGFIFPGTNTYLKSYGHGELLPVLGNKLLQHGPIKLPHSTNDAIIEAAKVYLRAVFKELIHSYEPDRIFLTGGDASAIGHVLEDLGATAKTNQRKDFIHHALKLILFKLA